MPLTSSLPLGFLLSALVGWLGYRRGSLSPSGVIGAILTGTAIFGFGGPVWGALLVLFFVSSSALSHFRAHAKEGLAEKFQKGSRRDLGQALANGGAAALAAALFYLLPHPALIAAFLGALATVTADTWATEVGVLSRAAPRLVTTLRPVPAGTSGGITLLGTSVAFLGAALIGLAWFVLQLDWSLLSLDPLPPAFWLLPGIAALGGLGGAMFDSYLGATFQAIYYCDFDNQETEQAVHRCGRRTRLLRGWLWLDNDAVNLLASLFGALAAAGLYFALSI